MTDIALLILCGAILGVTVLITKEIIDVSIVLNKIQTSLEAKDTSQVKQQ